MKFLQDSANRQDCAVKSSQANKKRKKDYAWTKEEDISAFFTSTRPTLADTHENTVPKSDHLSNSAATRRTAYPERARETPGILGLALRTAESNGSASKPRTGSRRRNHDPISYFSWSGSTRAPSAAPAQLETPLIVPKKLFGFSRHKYADGQCSRRATADQQMPTCDRSGLATTVVDRAMVSSAIRECSRLQSPPRCSYALQSLELRTRVADCCTAEIAALPQSIPPELNTGIIAAEHLDSPVRRERFRRESHGSEATIAPRQHQRLVSCESLQLPTSVNVVPQYHDHLSQAKSHWTRSFGAGATRARARELAETARQPGRISYRGSAQAYRPSNFSGPISFYVQQEQQQQLPLQYDLERDYDCQNADVAYADHVCESGTLEREDFDDVSERSALTEQMEEIDFRPEELGHVADGIVEQAQKCEKTGVVGPSFWQPHRLY